MTITQAQFQAWLQRDNQQRALLVEAQAYSAGGLVTRYLSNYPFVSLPTDSPANQVYDDLIINVPAFSCSLSELFTGTSSQSWGDIVLKNDGGALDAWLQDGWDGRSLKLYLGDPSWPRNDFQLILAGVTADITCRDAQTVSIKARDKQWLLTQPLQSNLIGGSGPNAGKPAPLTFGQVSNVSPLLIDAATHTYQVHDGQISDIPAVYINGVATGGYTKSPATGTFTLSAAPTGTVTCDVKGAAPGGVYLTKIADIVQHVLTTRTQLSAGDLDAASFAAFNSACPQLVGVFLNARTTAAALLDTLLSSVAGWYGFSRAGALRLGQINATSGAPDLALTVDDVKQFGVSLAQRQLPLYSVALGYARNWTVQATGLGSVSEARLAQLASEWQVASYTNAGVATKFLLAERAAEDALTQTALQLASDAATEAQRRATFRSQVRSVYQIECFCAPFAVDLGQIVQLTHPRFGFSAGLTGVVVGLTQQPTKNRLTLRLLV